MSFLEFFWERAVAWFDREDAAYMGVMAAVVGVAAGAGTAAIMAGATAIIAGAVGMAVAATIGLAVAESATAAGAAMAVAAAGAAVGLVYSFYFFPPLLPFLLACFVLAEAFFWASKKKLGKRDRIFWFTAKLKAFYFLEAGFWLLLANGWFYALQDFWKWLGLNQLIRFVGWGTAGLVVVAAVGFVFVKLNSVKFINNQRGRKK